MGFFDRISAKKDYGKEKCAEPDFFFFNLERIMNKRTTFISQHPQNSNTVGLKHF